MTHETKLWQATSATLVTHTSDTRPVCPGNFLKSPGCSALPAHALMWTSNASGLLGMGERKVYFACRRHVSALLELASATAVSGVTVSAYTVSLEAPESAPPAPQCSCRDCLNKSHTALQGGWTLCRECLDAECMPYPPSEEAWRARPVASDYECQRANAYGAEA